MERSGQRVERGVYDVGSHSRNSDKLPLEVGVFGGGY